MAVHLDEPGLAQLVERRTVEGIHGMENRRNPQVSGSNPEAGINNLVWL